MKSYLRSLADGRVDEAKELKQGTNVNKEAIIKDVQSGECNAMVAASPKLQKDQMLLTNLIKINPAVLTAYCFYESLQNVDFLETANFVTEAKGLIAAYIRKNAKQTTYRAMIKELRIAKYFANQDNETAQVVVDIFHGAIISSIPSSMSTIFIKDMERNSDAFEKFVAHAEDIMNDAAGSQPFSL